MLGTPSARWSVLVLDLVLDSSPLTSASQRKIEDEDEHEDEDEGSREGSPKIRGHIPFALDRRPSRHIMTA
jgi:hypothetical protein